MKICLITNLYPPLARGGAEIVVQNLACGLVAAGHSVSVITAAPFGAAWGRRYSHREDGVFVHRLFHWNIFFILRSDQQNWLKRFGAQIISLLNFPFALRAAQIIKREKPDVVHTHNLAGTSFLLPLFLRWLDIPHLHTAHDVQLTIPSGRLLVGEEFNWWNSGWAVNIFRYWQRWLWGNPRIVTAPSEWLLKYYSAHNFWPRTRAQVVRHFFDYSAVLTPAKKNAPTSALISERQKFTLLYVGQVERAKGALLITQIFSDLWNQGRAKCAELFIVGAGSDLRAVGLAAAGCPTIHLTGRIPSERVAQLIAVSAVVLAPSLLYENSPNIVMEALAIGRPVAISDVGGAAELVKKFSAGWVVKPDEQSWRQQIVWLLNNRDIVLKTKTMINLPNATSEFLELYKLLARSSVNTASLPQH